MNLINFSAYSKIFYTFHSVSEVLLSSSNLKEIYYTMLAAITTGDEGFGFNRGYILLFSPEKDYLVGHFALGPKDIDEAIKIWEEISSKNISLPQIVDNFTDEKFTQEIEKHKNILSKLNFSIADLKNSQSTMFSSIEEKKAKLVDYADNLCEIDKSLFKILATPFYAVVPLVTQDEKIGLLITDNFITKKPITNDDLMNLETFAFQAALAISRVLIYKKLEKKLAENEYLNNSMKEHQRTIIRLEKLATIGELVHHIAHQFKNPLIVIGGLTKQLLKKLEPNAPTYRYLMAVAKEAERLEDSLNYTLKELGQGYLWELSPQSIDKIVLEEVKNLQTLMNIKGIKLNLNIEEVPPTFINANALRECVIYLISNAIDAITNDGEITVSVFKKETEVFLIIQDNGAGISEENKAKIFEPFFTTKRHGTGLGLYNCQQTIRSFGGQIFVESELNENTKFIIRLPATGGKLDIERKEK